MSCTNNKKKAFTGFLSLEFCCSCLFSFFFFSSSLAVHHLPSLCIIFFCASSGSKTVHHLPSHASSQSAVHSVASLCSIFLHCASVSSSFSASSSLDVHHLPSLVHYLPPLCIVVVLWAPFSFIVLLCALSSLCLHQFPSLVRYLPSLCTIFLCASSSFSVHLRHRLSLVHHLLRCSIFLHRLPPVCIISLFSLLQGPALRKPHGIPHEARIVLWPSPSSLATRSPWPFLWPWPPYWHSVSLQRDRRCCWLLGQSRRREKNIKSITMVLILNNCRRKFSNAITTTEMAKLSQNDWYGVMCNLKNNDGVTIPCLWENSCMATKPRMIFM